MPVVDYLKESFVRKMETEDISCVLYTLFHSPCDVEKKLLSASSVFSLPNFMIFNAFCFRLSKYFFHGVDGSAASG